MCVCTCTGTLYLYRYLRRCLYTYLHTYLTCTRVASALRHWLVFVSACACERCAAVRRRDKTGMEAHNRHTHTRTVAGGSGTEQRAQTRLGLERWRLHESSQQRTRAPNRVGIGAGDRSYWQHWQYWQHWLCKLAPSTRINGQNTSRASSKDMDRWIVNESTTALLARKGWDVRSLHWQAAEPQLNCQHPDAVSLQPYFDDMQSDARVVGSRYASSK